MDKLRILESKQLLNAAKLKALNESLSSPNGENQELILKLFLEIVEKIEEQDEDEANQVEQVEDPTEPDCADVGEWDIQPDDPPSVVRKKQG